MQEETVSRREPKCEICASAGFDMSLTDGRVLHTACIDAIGDEISNLEAQLRQVWGARRDFESQVEQLKSESQSFMGAISNFFGARNFEKELAKLLSTDPRDQLAEQGQSLELKANKLAGTLESFYDYWPDYPPDWEERRDKMLAAFQYGCRECGTDEELQVHHKFSLQRGGNNKPENLEVLCIECHGHHHGVDFKKTGTSRSIKEYGDKETLIRKAIESGTKLTFLYRKWDEKKSNTRTIRPMGFKQVSARGGTKISLCVHGHCDLREEARVFALKRMSKLRLHDK